MTEKPRVLIFSLAYFPLVGGAEIAVKEITDHLYSPTLAEGEVGAPTSSVGVDFDLITLRFNKSHPAREIIGPVNVYRINGGKLAFPIRAFLLARKLHKTNPYNVSWSIMAAYAGFAALFFKFFNPRIPLLLTLQEGDSEKHILNRVGVFYPLWRLIFKKADYIQAISNYLADFAYRHGAKCPVEVVPNGVSLEKFKVESLKLKVKDKNSKTIITTSRLVHKNGVDVLIQAFARLKNLQLTTYNLQLLIVGDGPDRSKLEQLAKNLGVTEQIEFVGHVHPDEIPKYLAQADIFVRPSRSEGLGNSFLEAMAAGLPIVGTNVGGITDFLKDGETGLVCKVDDPKDLAEKIVKILNDAELCRKLSDSGRRLVKIGYSWENISKKIMRIIDKLPQKRLLLATGIYPPEIGGPATYAALLEQELPKHNIEVTVLPFRTVRKWPKGLAHFLFFLKSIPLLRYCDFVLVQDTISVGLPSLLAAKLLRKRFLIRVPGDYVWEQSVQRFGVNDSIDEFQIKRYSWKVEFMRSVQKFVVGRADVVITPSNYFRDLVRRWVKDKNKVVTIYNGIKIENPKSEIRNPKSKIILSAGRLVPWKGFSFLIDLMIDLPGWKLIIAGDGPEREALQFQVLSSKLQDRVELLGQIPRDRLMQKMSEADIFILNTSFESFSFQIVEAMSLGLPVIATKIGNLNEIIDNGVNGFLVEPNSKEQFLEAIKKIETDDGLRRRISESAVLKSGNFSIENTMNNLVAVLKNI